MAKKKLQDLINEQFLCVNIPDGAVQSFSGGDYQRIADLQRSLGVSISSRKLPDHSALVISGHRPCVYEASNEINMILRKAKEERDAELSGLMAAWQHQSQGAAFQNFNPETSYKLEQALKNQDPQVKVTIRGQRYTVQMPLGPATDDQGGTLEIKRIDLTEGLCQSDWRFSSLVVATDANAFNTLNKKVT